MRFLVIFLIIILNSFTALSQGLYDTLSIDRLIVEKRNLEEKLVVKPIWETCIVKIKSPNLSRKSPYLIITNKFNALFEGDSVIAIGYENDFVKVKFYNSEIGYVEAKHILLDEIFKTQITKFKNYSDLEISLDKLNRALNFATQLELQRIEEDNKKLYAEKDSIENVLRNNDAWVKYEKLKSPIAFLSAFVTSNSIGNPEANIRFFSISNKIIDAFSVDIYCYDNFNRAVNHYLGRSNIVKGISQITREKGFIDEASWDLFGHDNTTKIKVILRKIHFTDNTIWLANVQHPVIIKSF